MKQFLLTCLIGMVFGGVLVGYGIGYRLGREDMRQEIWEMDNVPFMEITCYKVNAGALYSDKDGRADSLLYTWDPPCWICVRR